MINFFKDDKLCMQRRYLGSFKAAKELAEKTAKEFNYTYSIIEIL